MIKDNLFVIRTLPFSFKTFQFLTHSMAFLGHYLLELHHNKSFISSHTARDDLVLHQCQNTCRFRKCQIFPYHILNGTIWKTLQICASYSVFFFFRENLTLCYIEMMFYCGTEVLKRVKYKLQNSLKLSWGVYFFVLCSHFKKYLEEVSHIPQKFIYNID